MTDIFGHDVKYTNTNEYDPIPSRKNPSSPTNDLVQVNTTDGGTETRVETSGNKKKPKV